MPDKMAREFAAVEEAVSEARRWTSWKAYLMVLSAQLDRTMSRK